jgi:hypothetical protein
MMTNQRLWTVSSILGVLCWLGLAYVVYSTDPEVSLNRLAFLLLLFVALLTTLSPLAHFLHFRFTDPKSYRSDVRRSFREGGLAALFIVLCTWLQMSRALNWINALLVLSALALIEAFILLRGP